ncbi:MAG TPA: tRNA dihydrouridine synthase DusB [Lentimicrobium sp.]|nr:tRNA dihydrouridine synthase DusB [Lentimicrobium sp.]
MIIGTIDLGDFPVLLAPMEDITDPPFRLICREMGASAVITEFIAADGLIRDVDKSIQKLDFSEHERPIGIQLFGNTVNSMVNAALVAEQANPDFIDLNFGCPVRKIVNKGGGAALLQDIPLLLEITNQIVKTVNKPVTVKTRLGWDNNSKIIVQLAEQLQDLGIAALTIHGRTRAQLYSGNADWTLIGEVKNNPRMHIPIIGNGDITDVGTAVKAYKTYGVDGIMIGRAAVGNPWLFRDIQHFLKTGETLQAPTIQEKLDVCIRHLEESVKWKGEMSATLEIRRHYSHYFKGLPDFKPFRMKLMTTTKAVEVFDILEEIRKIYF